MPSKNNTLDVQHVLAHFGLHSNFSCYTPTWSHDHKGGSLAVVIFDECFFIKARRRALLQPSIRVDHQILHFLRQAADSLFCSQIYHQSVPQILWDWGANANPSCSGYSVHQEWLQADYFHHPTLVQLGGILTLWCLDLHMISNLVKAVPGIWRCHSGVNPFYP